MLIQYGEDFSFTATQDSAHPHMQPFAIVQHQNAPVVWWDLSANYFL